MLARRLSPAALGSRRASAGPGKAGCARPPPRGGASTVPPRAELRSSCSSSDVTRKLSYLSYFINHRFPHLRVRQVCAVGRALVESSLCLGQAAGSPWGPRSRGVGVGQRRGYVLCQTPGPQEQWSVGATVVPSASSWPWRCGGGVGLVVILLGAHRGGLPRWL